MAPYEQYTIASAGLSGLITLFLFLINGIGPGNEEFNQFLFFMSAFSLCTAIVIWSTGESWKTIQRIRIKRRRCHDNEDLIELLKKATKK